MPASGAFRRGDPAGNRQFAQLGSFTTELGDQLPHVELAYETWGRLSTARDNAVLVLHALTGDSHVAGQAGPGHPTPGWWDALIGPGAPIDTDRYFVVAPNVLGGCQGSTGPSSPDPAGRPWGSRFPALTIRDQVRAEIALTTALGIDRWELVIGGSMGGMRVLEWAALAPERVHGIAPVATTAQSSADQIAWCHAQLAAIHADDRFRGGDYYAAADDDGPHRGLGAARRIAHTTYRSAAELEQRFNRQPQGDGDPLSGAGRFAVQSYLDHHAGTLVRRFDANSYVLLTQSMITHDLARGRGSLTDVLAGITAPALVTAVDSDRLYLPEQSQVLADGLPRATPLQMIHSSHGHDGFLVETAQLGALVTDFLKALDAAPR